MTQSPSIHSYTYYKRVVSIVLRGTQCHTEGSSTYCSIQTGMRVKWRNIQSRQSWDVTLLEFRWNLTVSKQHTDRLCYVSMWQHRVHTAIFHLSLPITKQFTSSVHNRKHLYLSSILKKNSIKQRLGKWCFRPKIVLVCKSWKRKRTLRDKEWLAFTGLFPVWQSLLQRNYQTYIFLSGSWFRTSLMIIWIKPLTRCTLF